MSDHNLDVNVNEQQFFDTNKSMVQHFTGMPSMEPIFMKTIADNYLLEFTNRFADKVQSFEVTARKIA